MSTITFNFSVAGSKSWIKDYKYPLQIMPQTTAILTNEIINSYPEIKDKEYSNSVIHTSYITRPFGDLQSEGKINSFRHNIKQYIKLCHRIKYKYLLIHLPASQKEMNNFGNGMSELIEIFNNEPKLTLLLETPSFVSGFKMDMIDYIKDIIVNTFKLFKNKNVEICIDTAHLYANYYDSEDIIKLLSYEINDKKIIDYVNVIHLNGNTNNKGKSDRHTPIFEENNKMTCVEKLMKYLSDKNKILITENTTNHTTYINWETFAKKYNLNIVPEHKQASF